MSGTPPYVYLSLGENLTALGDTALQYLYDNVSTTVILIGDYDLFEGGCVAVKPSNEEHPFGSWNVKYPYCRTALKYRMDDPRGNPQLGQFVPVAPNISIKLVLVGCDMSAPVTVTTKVEPTQPGCAADLYPGYAISEFFLIVDTIIAVLPMRVYFTITNGAGKTKTFWVGIRDSRSGLASQSVVGAKP